MKPIVEENKDIKMEDLKEQTKIEDSNEKVKIEDAKEKADSDQEMMNLENELYSLTHYADDEEELVAQMFATIKGSKLEAMMPPILKEIPLIDVQQLCLHELRGMSQRRILSIINGQEMSGSSSEDSDDEKKPSKTHDDNEDSNTGRKYADDGEDLLTGKDLSELENVNESNLTALDILELEMRAKLIKTMLEKDGEDDKEENTDGLFDPDIIIKEEPLSPKRDGKSPSRSESRRRSRYSRSRRRRRRRSDSRSYSSSSRSSYSSRSYSRSYSSRSRSYSSDRKRDISGSPDSAKKEAKKKLTKKEFEERMKKAKMNRTYRKRKESEEDSGDDSKGKKGTKKKEDVSDPSKKEAPDKLPDTGDAGTEENKPEQEGAEEGEDKQVEEGEVEEKEEGEIDSNEERAYSPISSRSRSYSSYSSSFSSRSRSYSRSPRRRSKRKSKKSKKKYRRSRSRSLSDVPKIPNWKPEDAQKNGLETKPEVGTPEPVNLPDKEERESVSFSIKKNNTTVKTNSEVTEEKPDSNSEITEEIPVEAAEEGTKVTIENLEVVDEKMDTSIKEDGEDEEEEEEELSYTPPPPSSKEMTEDFYKGADQLSLSEEEGECEDEVEMEKFLHDDTPVELISDEKANPGKSVSKNEPSVEELGSLPNADDSSQDMLEQLPETETEDSNHNLEIIGVIEPSGSHEENFDEELAAGGSSWSMRWLQSEKVQKVVSNSTLLSKVRKKIQAKGKRVVKESSKAFPKHVVEIKPESPKVENKPQPTKPSIVIGSLEEYEKLIGIKVKAPTSLPQPKPQSKAVSQAVSLLDSGDEDDSEDDAIWSKIIKK